MNTATKVVAAVGVTVAVMGACEITAKADPISDQAFISVLDSYGVTYTSQAKAIASGHAVCDAIPTLGLLPTVEVVYQSTSLSRSAAGYFVGASIGAYCPQYTPMIPGAGGRTV